MSIRLTSHITHHGHVRFTATDVEQTRFFFETGLGLEVAEKICMHLFLCAIKESGHRSPAKKQTEQLRRVIEMTATANLPEA